MTNSEHIPNGQVSDERLAEIADKPTGYGISMDEISDMASELLTRRSSAGVKGLAGKILDLAKDGDRLTQADLSFNSGLIAAANLVREAALEPSPAHIGEDEVPTADRDYADIDDPRRTGLTDLMADPSPSVPPQGETSGLLPCPFCGGPAKEPIHYNGTMETGCAGPHECPGTDVLVPLALWNRRALTPSPTLEPTEAAKLVIAEAWESHSDDGPIYCVNATAFEALLSALNGKE